jgi:hypothetical protein
MHIRSAATTRHARPCPGIHVFRAKRQEDVDGRDKPGHDGKQALALADAGWNG